MVTLRDITPDNWIQCIKLSVDEGQKDFVASNTYSLAEARVFPSRVPLAIYHDDAMVGFAMYGIDEHDGEMWILRLMIDRAHQRKGYGRAALQLLLDRISREAPQRDVIISFVPKNADVEPLYRSVGFVHTGRIIDGEVVMKRTSA